MGCTCLSPITFRELTGGELLQVLEKLGGFDLSGVLDLADMVLGMATAWLELVASEGAEEDTYRGNTEAFQSLVDCVKDKLKDEEDFPLRNMTNIVAAVLKANENGLVQFPSAESLSRIELTSSANTLYRGLLLRGSGLHSLYKREMDEMENKASLATSLLYLDCPDDVSNVQLQLEYLEGEGALEKGVSNDTTACAMFNKFGGNNFKWTVDGKDGKCSALVGKGGVICNCTGMESLDKTFMFGAFQSFDNLEGNLTTTTIMTTTTETSTTTPSTSETTSNHSTERTTADTNTPTSTPTTTNQSSLTTSDPPSTPSQPCSIHNTAYNSATFPYSITLLVLAQIVLVAVAVIHIFHNYDRILPKLLNFIFLAVVLQIFLTNWIYLGLVSQRETERLCCDFSCLSDTVNDYKVREIFGSVHSLDPPGSLHSAGPPDGLPVAVLPPHPLLSPPHHLPGPEELAGEQEDSGQ